MSAGMPERRAKTALKAALTAALKAETVGKGSQGGASPSGSVDELKEVIGNSVASQNGSGSGSGAATMQQQSVSGGTGTGTDFDASGFGRIDGMGSAHGNSNSNSNDGSGNGSEHRSGRQSICNVIFGDDAPNSGNGNGNDNGSIGSSSGGLFSRLFRRVDRLLRRWLPGYNYLRGGSGGSADLSSVIVGNASGNANENANETVCEDTVAGAEVASEEPLALAQVQVQVQVPVPVQRGGSFSTMSGHRNKWMSNDIYLSGGITRAEFSAHLEGILQKRMLKENQETVLYLEH